MTEVNGKSNRVCGIDAHVGGGSHNRACGRAATVGGGTVNKAWRDATTVGGGISNSADGYAATIGGGIGNEIEAEGATIGGGNGNVARAPYASIPGGKEAMATYYGEMALAAGAFSRAGDAQVSHLVMRRETRASEWCELFLDGQDALLTVPSYCTLAITIMVVARGRDGRSAAFAAEGMVRSDVRVVPRDLSVRTISAHDPTWGVRIWADEESQALRIQVRGDDSEVIRWVASVQIVKVINSP